MNDKEPEPKPGTPETMSSSAEQNERAFRYDTRVTALEFAAGSYPGGYTADQLLKSAREIEAYLTGETRDKT